MGRNINNLAPDGLGGESGRDLSVGARPCANLCAGRVHRWERPPRHRRDCRVGRGPPPTDTHCESSLVVVCAAREWCWGHVRWIRSVVQNAVQTIRHSVGQCAARCLNSWNTEPIWPRRRLCSGRCRGRSTISSHHSSGTGQPNPSRPHSPPECIQNPHHPIHSPRSRIIDRRFRSIRGRNRMGDPPAGFAFHRAAYGNVGT